MARLVFIHAVMGAGKTAALLVANHSELAQGRKTLIFSPACDVRVVGGILRSQVGIKAPVRVFAEGEDLFWVVAEWIGAPSWTPSNFAVFVDEAQFLTAEQTRQLASVADNLGIEVRCYGLRCDFLGRLFRGAQALLALADDFVEMESRCKCGRLAKMHLRVDGSGEVMREGDVVQIGGAESYRSVCRRCFKKGMERRS